MYTVAEIPALKEMILSNAALLHREEGYGAAILKGGSSKKLDVIITQTRNESYAASLVDTASLKVLMQTDPDDNPAMAVFKLFNETAAKLTKALAEQVPQGDDPDATAHPKHNDQHKEQQQPPA